MVRKCTVRQASECGMQYWIHPLDGTAAFVISGRILCIFIPMPAVCTCAGEFIMPSYR